MIVEHCEALDASRIARAKRSFTTRRIAPEQMFGLKTANWAPAAGDLLLARVEKIGQHRRIELPDGRRAFMFPGDEVIVCCGSRYAPDQFEAVLHDQIWPTDLVAAGGVASTHVSRRAGIKAPTRLRPLGAVCNDNGEPLNVAQFALTRIRGQMPITAILVAGTNMNAGKTTSAAALVHGLAKAGHKVGAAKVTGTGAGPDPFLMKDSGAHIVLDFTDVGYASTSKLEPCELETIANNLINHLAREGCDIAVLEVADGLLQPETAALLSSSAFRLRISKALFTAYDAMGAVAGVDWLRARGYRLLGLSGQLSSSPLGAKEAEAITGLPVYTLTDLIDGPVPAAAADTAHIASRAS